MTRLRKITFALLLLSLTLTQCGQYSDATFVPLDKSSIDSVIITTRDDKLNKKLTEAQVDELVKSINSATSVGLYKGVVTYRLNFYHTDKQTKDTLTRFIMADGTLFKFKYETGDEAFAILDTTLFKRLAESGTKQEYTVTIRKNQKDSTFVLSSTDSHEKYFTELWVSDPECTECKDCYVDSGAIKIPIELKQFIDKEWLKDFYLTCNNPYDIEKEAYVKYILKGQITGAKHGRPVFCVTEWKRQ